MSNTKELTFGEIIEHQNALIVLGNAKLPIAYQVAKNMKRVSDKISEIQKEILELQKLHCELDELGNPQTKVVEGRREIVFKSDEDKKVYDEAYKKFLEEKHAIDFHRIGESAVSGLTVEGAALAILLDTVIVPDSEVAGRK